MKPDRRRHVLIFVSLLGFLAWFKAPASFATEARFQEVSVIWHLTGGRVVYPGDTLTIDRSTLMTGYMVEAVAASSNGPVRQGVFRAILTAFSPLEGRAGHDAHFWYLAGRWTITETGQEEARMDFRPDALVLQGNLVAEGLRNPISEQGVFGAPLKFLMTLAGNCPGVGEGIFLGSEGFEGHIRMKLAPGRRD